ncbi:MAG: response regulator with CheY-like receiver domain and winged-helix DNA-binding domain [Bacteroidetes bacterium]|nr:response regulator with CheY-like receiver domain and winged-helix DNA-binding domain [Bacteroidota bacterium]
MAKKNKEYVILLVDDEREIIFVQRAVYELDPNIRLITAYNGVQALDHLVEKRAFENEMHLIPDLIICDASMPRMDGFEFLRNIKAVNEFKNIPVYILTGTEESLIKKHMLDLGAADCITKPIDARQIKPLIADILNNVGYEKKERV